MIAEDRVVDDDLLQKFDELVGEVGGHERLDRDGDVLGVLRLGEGGLDNLGKQTDKEINI